MIYSSPLDVPHKSSRKQYDSVLVFCIMALCYADSATVSHYLNHHIQSYLLFQIEVENPYFTFRLEKSTE